MTVTEFIDKWKQTELRERAASHEHFLDLCRLVDHPTPGKADPGGHWFTFERGASKATGGQGWADVWKRGFFGWEYKGKSGDLKAAYAQLLLYQGALENPPLLVVSDMDRIVVHSHFPNTPTEIHDIALDSLIEEEQLAKLRAIFHAPEWFRPGQTIQKLTEDAAQLVADIAQGLRQRGMAPQAVARFLDRVVFCLFAEDVGLLPPRLFTRVVENSGADPAVFVELVSGLFAAMANGGYFGADIIQHFNGDLFTDATVLELTPKEIRHLLSITSLDWGAIDPSIFGTLFERGLDPDKRAQLGAHYTSREDIQTIVEPVVIAPLRREWMGLRGELEPVLRGSPSPQQFTGARARVRRFLTRLQGVTVLDPACGSGNFLYVTLQLLKDLEKEVIVFASPYFAFLPEVGPWQLYGIEVNAYAFELSQMTVWIGYLQWVSKNGFGQPDEPILKPMTNFQNRDAILQLTPDGDPSEPEWPATEFIVSNPPFAGRAKLREYLGDGYVDTLFQLWDERVPAGADYCCYWFEKSRSLIEAGKCKRAGLLATQAIRSGANRRALENIKLTGNIFFAESDRPWTLDGAAVRVSMVGFDDGSEKARVLDGTPVGTINIDLSTGVDVTRARALERNRDKCFQGPVKVGSFDISFEAAAEMLAQPNPHGRPNSDVVRPWWNGKSITERNKHKFIIDFDDRSRSEAALYEKPFAHVEVAVKPARLTNRDRQRRERWWMLGRSGGDLRAAVRPLQRFVATVRVSKHRLWVWADRSVLPDARLYAVAIDAEMAFGVLQSRVHEVWSLANVAWHGVGNDPTYKIEECFVRFPFPEPSDDQAREIATAALRLIELRNGWLHPTEWVHVETLKFRASIDGPWGRLVQNADEVGVGDCEYRYHTPVDDEAAELVRKRTLTRLYNEYPEWLTEAHGQLDDAVFRAYGWDSHSSDGEVLKALLNLNFSRSAAPLLTAATTAPRRRSRQVPHQE
jgi:hypothetical protein